MFLLYMIAVNIEIFQKTWLLQPCWKSGNRLTDPPSDVPLFHHQMICCCTLSVPLFHHQMLYCSTISVPLYYHQMFYCSTIRCSTVPPSEVLLFHHDCSTFPSSDVPLFHHQMFYFSTTRCSNVPPSVFHRFTISVTLFLHQMVHCSTIFFALFHN